MNCLTELFANYRCRCRRRHGATNSSNSSHNDDRARPLKFSRTRAKRQHACSANTATTCTDSEMLTRAFFESCLPVLDHTESSTTMLETSLKENADPVIKVKLGSMKKKELQSAPSGAAYMSNHVVVNQERRQRDIPLMTRCSILDEMAKGKAQEMAQLGRVLKPYHSATMVESVHKTPSLQLMHQLVMHGIDNSTRQHILDPRFCRFGMGTAKGPKGDGMIYVSQLFQATATISSNANQASTNTLTTVTADTTTEDVPIKNPRTRVLPAYDFPVDPAILQGHKKKRNKQHEGKQGNDINNKASHKRTIVVAQ